MKEAYIKYINKETGEESCKTVIIPKKSEALDEFKVGHFQSETKMINFI